MADNLSITPGSGSSVRTHESGGVHTPIYKIATGATNATNTIIPPAPTTKANSIPVALPTDGMGRQAPADSLGVVTPLETAAFLTSPAGIAAASLTSSFQSVGTWAAGTRIGTLTNSTNVWTIWSFNNSNNHRRVPPNSKESIDFGANGLISAVTCYVKYESAAGNNSGVATIEGVSI